MRYGRFTVPRSTAATRARGSPRKSSSAAAAKEKAMRLNGKIGIVTAAASGMGRAGALRFAREGAAVAVVDLDRSGVDAVVGEITAAGGRALGIVGNLEEDDFARGIVRRTATAFGGLDFV